MIVESEVTGQKKSEVMKGTKQGSEMVSEQFFKACYFVRPYHRTAPPSSVSGTPQSKATLKLLTDC